MILGCGTAVQGTWEKRGKRQELNKMHNIYRVNNYFGFL